MQSRKSTILAIAAACALGTVLCLCAGCTQQVSSDALTADEESTTTSYTPEVIERDDGTLVQRTPTETVDETALDTSYVYYHQDEDTVAEEPYNTYYLDADERGCNSCHDDLADTLAKMDYAHVDLRNNYGIQITEQMCEDCHTFGYGYQTNQNSFGSLIHGIHKIDENTNCWSCHAATGSGDGMQLWDNVKHQQLRGITAVSDTTGDFSYDQEKITPTADLFDFGWRNYDLDYMREQNTASNAPLDQDTFDNWTITISGAVNQEITYTLPELIAKFGTETVPLTLHCTYNPIGGPLIGNCVYTGVPLNKLLEEAGMTDDAGALTVTSPDGNSNGLQLSNYTKGYLVVQVNGEALPWKQGYPVQLIVPGTGAPVCVKEVCDIVVNTKEEATNLYEWNGWPKEAGEGDYYTTSGWPFVNSNGYVNKPNVGLFDFEEGQIVTTGESYEFSGYAAAYDEKIAALEFSMDGGSTWTRYETPDVTRDNWVIWHFSYTPETDSAYVLSVRSVTDTGLVTDRPIEVMFNAKSA